MGKIVALGEIVADIYRAEGSSDAGLPFVARSGGAPANVAVAASRLGAEAAFLGSVGRDLFGDFALRVLEAEGVAAAGVTRQEPPTRTSIAFVEIDEAGERSFTFYRSDPAADELLSPEDVEEDLFSGASFVNFGSIPLITEPVRSAVHRAVEVADERGVPVAFDVNFREHLWESVDTACEVVEPLLGRSRIVKLSDDEILAFFDTDSPERAARKVLDRGAELVFVSLGPDGAFYAAKDFTGSVPAHEVDLVDPTGAGDAFLAAALVRLSEADSWDEETVRAAALRGSAAGALACTEYGAMSALPTREELENFLGDRG